MPQEQENKQPEATLESLQEANKQLQDQLKQQDEIRQSVLADPDIRAVLEAKQKGEKVKIAMGNEPEEKKDRPSLSKKFASDDEPDFNALDNAGLLGVVSEAVEEYVNSALEDAVSNASKAIDTRLHPILDSQTKLKQAVLSMAQNTQAINIANQHPDFAQYQQDAFKLAQTHGLSLEDAYLLAKSKNSDRVPDNVASEQPLIPQSREVNLSRRTRTPDDSQNGRTAATARTFRNSLNSAVERAMKKVNRQGM